MKSEAPNTPRIDITGRQHWEDLADTLVHEVLDLKSGLEPTIHIAATKIVDASVTSHFDNLFVTPETHAQILDERLFD